jgi:hypothetical protein
VTFLTQPALRLAKWKTTESPNLAWRSGDLGDLPVKSFSRSGLDAEGFDGVRRGA